MAFNPLQTFLQEAEELIADIEQSALGLGTENASEETVHRLFRAFHTIKGSGAMCGLDALAGFTHHIETLLDTVRDGKVPVSSPLIELVLKATDHIKLLLNEVQGGAAVTPASTAALVGTIAGFANSGIEHRSEIITPTATPTEENHAEVERMWHIRFEPNPTLLANGGNPMVLFKDLRKLGSCEIVTHADAVPTLDQLQVDRCYFYWTITLRASCSENDIQDVFIFVEDDGKLDIKEAGGPPQQTNPTAAPVEQAVVDQPRTESAARSGAPSPKKATKEATVRVPAERLDRLVNLVGEFVMNQSCLAQAVSQTAASDFSNSIQVLERLVAELRDNVLGIRMLPIGSLFGRFRRVVHDLSSELGKDAELVTEGDETELDKSILDQLSEPLVHCLRNCLDHGIEPAAERLQKGKSSRATVRLSAAHTGSSVVIRIEDDGRGIDRKAVREKAVEKRLIAPDAVLSDRDILNLILLPGFSTARQVTSVSGRGVGMDAVKRQIDLLRGSLSLESVEGKGTAVSIALPLTLAIIDGLLVQIGAERFIIPMASVTENVELQSTDRSRNNGRNVLAVRGELIPYIDLRQAFGIGGTVPEIEKVVIVQHGDDRVGLVVERVVGAHQTVIQSLGKFYRNVEVVSGATIMGDGRVALILDIAAVVRHAEQRNQAPVLEAEAPREQPALC